MAVTVASSGTQTAVITTEHSLYTTAAAGVFVVEVDWAALLDTEIVELRIKGAVLSAGTVRMKYAQTLYGAAPVDDAIWSSVPCAVDAAVTLLFTLKQLNGTGRAFPWKVLSL